MWRVKCTEQPKDPFHHDAARRGAGARTATRNGPRASPRGWYGYNGFSSSLGASARTPTRPNWKPRRGDAAHEATLRHRGNKTTRLTSAARDDRVCAHHAHVMGARATSKISAGRTLSQPQTEAASIPGIVREQGSWCGAAFDAPSAAGALYLISAAPTAAQTPQRVPLGCGREYRDRGGL